MSESSEWGDANSTSMRRHTIEVVDSAEQPRPEVSSIGTEAGSRVTTYTTSAAATSRAVPLRSTVCSVDVFVYAAARGSRTRVDRDTMPLRYDVHAAPGPGL